MTARTCRLVSTSATEDACSVSDVIARTARDAPPLLAWAEPDPLRVGLSPHTGGRREDFQPLVRGMPAWPTDLPLIEVRLFWPHAALHVLATHRDGCRWVRIEEIQEGDSEDAVMRSELPIHTQRDLRRFGLQESAVIDGLWAIEYRRQGRLMAWRLVLGLQESPDA